MSDVGAVTQAGVISTQVAASQKPLVEDTAPAQQVQKADPPPPPVESGRGETVDTTA